MWKSDELLKATSRRLHNAATNIVPWFLEQMPAPYFRDTDRKTVEEHLGAIIAARSSGQPLALTIKSRDENVWTFIHDDDRTGLLSKLTEQLPKDQTLRSARIYTAKDGTAVIDVFSFQDQPRFCNDDKAQNEKLRAFIDGQSHLDEQLSSESILEHAQRCHSDYIMSVSARRFWSHLKLFQKVSDSDDVYVTSERSNSEQNLSRIFIVAANADATSLFHRTVRYLSTNRIDIRRAYLECIDDNNNGAVSILTFVCFDPENEFTSSASKRWKTVRQELSRIAWIDDRVLDYALANPKFSFESAEIFFALCDLVHQRLVAVDSYRFSKARIQELAFRIQDLVLEVCKTVQQQSIKPISQEDLAAIVRNLQTSSSDRAAPGGMRRVFGALCDAALAIRQTNLRHKGRYALGLRIEPSYLHADQTPLREIPFGVFYFSGRDFNGFHCRFRDIARGGLRVVTPRSLEAHSQESERLYSEVWGLAYAQQLKNKDIPEGGSKGVILASPGSSITKSVRAYGNTLLDLTVGDGENSQPNKTLIYLGPDENITPELINWMVKRARERGHPRANAFMSSKPGAGINHKEYGVTSEGVIVFLEEALKTVGINPRTTPFTVKLTGGPDGDVAGNAIRIMHREFGENARILGIADGSGSAEDPNGLNIQELLRLVETNSPIVNFKPACLGTHGKVTGVDSADGLAARNTLHERLITDAFVPCGGRPATVNKQNAHRLLSDSKQANTKVVVEGANLFFTEDARHFLSETSDVLFVKDSSANKCGVICSSYEITAAMLLSEADFLRIKPRFVTEVVDRLKNLARREAKLLFREHNRALDLPLSKVSVAISAAINEANDAIVPLLVSLNQKDTVLTQQLIERYLPASLLEAAGTDGISELPRAYIDRIIASSLACEIIYHEGKDFFRGIRQEDIGAHALRYLRREEVTRTLINDVQNSSLTNKEAIIELLAKGGTRTALEN